MRVKFYKLRKHEKQTLKLYAWLFIACLSIVGVTFAITGGVFGTHETTSFK